MHSVHSFAYALRYYFLPTPRHATPVLVLCAVSYSCMKIAHKAGWRGGHCVLSLDVVFWIFTSLIVGTNGHIYGIIIDFILNINLFFISFFIN